VCGKLSYKMEDQNASSGFGKMFHKVKPYLAMVSLQFGYSGMYIITMVSFKHGMSHWVLSVYRHIVATLIMAPFAFFLERSFSPPQIFHLNLFISFSIHVERVPFNVFFCRLRLFKNKTHILSCKSCLFSHFININKHKHTKIYERKTRSMHKVFTFITPVAHNYHVQKVMFLPFYAFCSYFNFFP